MPQKREQCSGHLRMLQSFPVYPERHWHIGVPPLPLQTPPLRHTGEHSATNQNILKKKILQQTVKGTFIERLNIKVSKEILIYKLCKCTHFKWLHAISQNKWTIYWSLTDAAIVSCVPRGTLTDGVSEIANTYATIKTYRWTQCYKSIHNVTK